MLSKNQKKRKSWQSLAFPIVLGIFFIAVLAFIVVSNWRISQKRAELNTRIDALKSELQDLETKNAQLKSDISQSKTQDYVEKVAREDLNMQKPGEEVVVVKQPTSSAETAPQAQKSFWQKILEKLHL